MLDRVLNISLKYFSSNKNILLEWTIGLSEQKDNDTFLFTHFVANFRFRDRLEISAPILSVFK